MNIKDNNQYVLLSVLLVVSAVSRFPFVLSGFGDIDTAGLAVSTIDFISHGENGFLNNLYFLDVVPLYVTYIKFVMKMLNNDYQYVPVIMNYTSAVFGTLILIPTFFFTRKLTNNNTISFCTAITFVFTPSIYQASVYGFPSLVALFFFLTSLFFFLKWLEDSINAWLILSFISLTLTVLFKNDFILGSGAYFGLLYMRKVREKEKIVLTIVMLFLAFLSLFFLRQWLIGISKGYTTSYSNFMEWVYLFLEPLFSKSFSQLMKNQVVPIAYGTGFISFFISGLALFIYVIKKKTDVIVFVLSWAACPTFLWLVLWNNNARHNMLSVLPFLIVIFMLIHERAPKIMVFVPILLILGNFFVTPPSASIREPSGNLFESQVLLNNQSKNIHMAARKIAELDDNKLIFMTEAFRPYLLFEVLSLTPEYKLIDIGDSCYRIENKHKECMICFYINFDQDPVIYIKDLISNHHLEKYTIVAPMLDLKVLKEEGFKKIDKADIKTWIKNKSALPFITGSQD